MAFPCLPVFLKYTISSAVSHARVYAHACALLITVSYHPTHFFRISVFIILQEYFTKFLLILQLCCLGKKKKYQEKEEAPLAYLRALANRSLSVCQREKIKIIKVLCSQVNVIGINFLFLSNDQNCFTFSATGCFPLKHEPNTAPCGAMKTISMLFSIHLLREKALYSPFILHIAYLCQPHKYYESQCFPLIFNTLKILKHKHYSCSKSFSPHINC